MKGKESKLKAVKISNHQIRESLTDRMKDVVCTFRAIRRHGRILSKTRI